MRRMAIHYGSNSRSLRGDCGGLSVSDVWIFIRWIGHVRKEVQCRRLDSIGYPCPPKLPLLKTRLPAVSLYDGDLNRRRSRVNDEFSPAPTEALGGIPREAKFF
jgi:hypothetical protein